MRRIFRKSTVGVQEGSEGSSVDPELYSTPNEIVKEFQESVRERSINETTGGVTDSYRAHSLIEPGREYYTTLKRIDFYQGACLPSRQEYVKEEVFCIGEVDSRGLGEISKDEILHFSENQRYKAIVGQAGSGKTTLMKRLARDVIEGKLLIKNGNKEPFQPRVVHYLNIRDIPVTGEEMKTISPCDLLFSKVMANVKKSTITHGFEWLQTTQEGAVFFFDGLDQAPWGLENASNPMRYEDESNTSTIMMNLFKGNLFPNVLIVVSSRQHTFAPLKGDLRPHEFTALAGLTMVTRKQIFIELAGEKGEMLWNVMCKKSPALVPLGSIPIFLVFIVIVYKLDPNNPPDTMTGVMIKILQIFLQSDHAHERENIGEILNGLKKMSFKGTEEKRVLFTQEDLTEFKLIVRSVRDLVVFVPGSTLLGRNLMEGHYRLFFCHQSIQEMLTALNIIEMSRKNFIKFVTKSSKEDHWSVVRRFLCGVLLNEETYNDATVDLIKVTDLKYKKKILKRSMTKQLKARLEGRRDQLEMFAALYEASDSSFIESCVHNVHIENQALTSNDLYVISSMLLRCSEVEKVRLCQCNLSDEAMDILNAGLKICKIKILDLSGNIQLGVEGWRIFGSIVDKCEVEKVVFNGSVLSIDVIKAFQECLGNSKIKALDVSLNAGMTSDVCRTIGSIVKKFEVQNLEMGGGRLSTDAIEALQAGLGNSKIERLSLICNEISNEGFLIICSIICQCQVKKMFIDRCTIKEVEDSPIKVGILSVKGRTLRTEEMSALGNVLRYYHEMEVVELDDCGLTADGINAFKETIGKIKIKFLDVNANPDMGADAYRSLGSMVQACQVEGLSMRNCKFSTDEIKCLQEGLGNSKIRLLDVSSNRGLGTSNCAAIGSIVRKCDVAELKMRDCEHSIDELQALQEGLNDAKLENFNLTMPDYPTPEYLKAIADLVHLCHAKTFVLYNGSQLDSVDKLMITDHSRDTKVSFVTINPSTCIVDFYAELSEIEDARAFEGFIDFPD